MLFVNLYLLGLLPTLAVTTAIAVKLRTSHAMSPVAMSLLILSTALIWPLLVVAAGQAVVLLGLSKGLGTLMGRSNRVSRPVVAQESQGMDLPAVA